MYINKQTNVVAGSCVSPSISTSAIPPVVLRPSPDGRSIGPLLPSQRRLLLILLIVLWD